MTGQVDIEKTMIKQLNNSCLAPTHEYPDDPEIQAAILNKAFTLAETLIEILHHIEDFSARFGRNEG